MATAWMHRVFSTFQSHFICEWVRVWVSVLPGFIKVFSCVGHSTGGPQPLTQRSSGHIHKLLLLLSCTHNTCILQHRQDENAAAAAAACVLSVEDGPSAGTRLFSDQKLWELKTWPDGCSQTGTKTLPGDQRSGVSKLPEPALLQLWALNVPAQDVPPGWSQPCGGWGAHSPSGSQSPPTRRTAREPRDPEEAERPAVTAETLQSL